MPPTLKSFATSESGRSHEIERDVHACTPARSTSLGPLRFNNRSVCDVAHNLLSYLGNNNPWPQTLTGHEEVWLMDNTAFPAAPPHTDAHRRQDHVWQAEFVTAVFSQRTPSVISDTVIELADKIGLADDEDAKRTMEERLRPFLLDIQPGRKMLALHGADRLALELGPGGRSGISQNVKTLNAPPTASSAVVTTTVQTPKSTTGLLQSKTFFSEAQGWAVISDVDDTIKVTMTSDTIGILRSTFVDEPQPVPGTPELYQFLQSQVTPASPFFYLSASPYNLYPFLRNFRDEYFPYGQLILRDSSWMSIPGLISHVTLGTQEYKTDRLKKIHNWLPKKNVIAIGDSTQSDPEAYAEAYRVYGPDWIRLILIRRVTGVAVIGIDEKNEPERFEKAFKGVPKSVWHVFEDPRDCYQVIRDRVQSHQP